jgi:hypothetical protein
MAMKRASKKGIKRTTHRSRSGTKLWAVRDSKGRFKDIQTYERAIRTRHKARRTTRRQGTNNTGPRRK